MAGRVFQRVPGLFASTDTKTQGVISSAPPSFYDQAGIFVEVSITKGVAAISK